VDVGTGTGSRAVELGATGDIGWGRVGARAVAGYTRQAASEYVARVTSPDQPFAPLTNFSTVRSDPGDVLRLSLRPFLRLAPPLAILAGVDHWRRGAASVSYRAATDSVPGVPASLLAIGTGANATTLALGVTYSNPGRSASGGSGIPLDVSWTYERVIGSSEGRVPKLQAVRAQIRLYQRLFH
jgi:hypothetical protein